jgi:Glucodextranase, domain B/6-bladed beta-propeller
MMTTRASRVLKVLVISLVVAAISRGGAATAATLPVVTGQGVIVQALRTPTRLTLGEGGSLYVADPASQGILKFSAAGNLTQKIGVKGIPQGIAVTADGRLLVSLKESVAIYDATGTKTGVLGSGIGQFILAADITLDDAGLIYVTDSKGACVQVFRNDGAYLTRFGVKGSGDGQFRFPTSIAFEKVSRQLAIVDSLNGRVQFYDLAGAYQRSIGAIGTGPLKFMHPQGLAFEYGAADAIRMYVSDAMVKKIQAIDPTGSGMFLSYVNDTHDGHALPSELAFDQATHRLYVVNGLGGVSYFQIIDGNVVVNSTGTAAPGTATVLASAAQAGTAAVTLSAASTVAPFILSTVADGSTVTSELLDITGLATGVSTVTVNGQPVSVANGLFSTAVALAAGANEISVSVTDNAGKVWKDVRSVIRDTTAPEVTIADADVLATGKAVLNLNGTTDRSAYVSVAGVPADLNKLEWSSAVTLTTGINTIEVQAIDLVGQASSRKRTVIYTPGAPELAIISPAEDLVTGSKKITVQGIVTASGETTVTADVNGVLKKVKVDAGRFTIPLEFTKDGSYTVTLFAAAEGGDVSTISRTIVYRTAQ